MIQQKIKNEETQVHVIERMQEIEIQEQEIIRKERELDAMVILFPRNIFQLRVWGENITFVFFLDLLGSNMIGF